MKLNRRHVDNDVSADNVSSLRPRLTLSSHKEAVTAVAVSADCSQAVSVSRGGVLKIHSVTTGRQERSATLTNTPLSSLLTFLPSTVVVGSFDSNM